MIGGILLLQELDSHQWNYLHRCPLPDDWDLAGRLYGWVNAGGGIREGSEVVSIEDVGDW